MSDKKISRDKLVYVAKDFNENLGLDPEIKVTTKTTVKSLMNDIKEVVEELEDGDVITQKSVEILCDLEFDLPAKLKIKKPSSKKSGKKTAAKKSSTAKKPSSSADVDAYGYRKGTKNSQFIASVKKKPMTMGEVKKQSWNDTETTFYTLLSELVDRKIAKVDDDKKIHIIK